MRQSSEPVVGLKPRELHEKHVRQHRQLEILEAMRRHAEVDQLIPAPWMDEFSTLWNQHQREMKPNDSAPR